MLSHPSSSSFLSPNSGNNPSNNLNHHSHLLPPIDHIVNQHPHHPHHPSPYHPPHLNHHPHPNHLDQAPVTDHHNLHHHNLHHHHHHQALQNHHHQLNPPQTPNHMNSHLPHQQQQQSMSNSQPPNGKANIRRSVSYSTTTNSGRPPPKTSRRQSKLNNLDRRRICEYAAAHPKSTQEDIALQWGIDRSSVSKILKYRDKWLSISPNARAAKVIKHRGGRFPQLETEVVRRCREKSLNGGFLGDRTIKDVALDVSQEMGLGHGAFKASNGWLDAFKERAQIKAGRFLDLSIIPDQSSLSRASPLRPHNPNGTVNNGAGNSPGTKAAQPSSGAKRSSSFQDPRSESSITGGDRMVIVNTTPTKRSKSSMQDENHHLEIDGDDDNDEDEDEDEDDEDDEDEDEDDEDEDEEQEDEEDEMDGEQEETAEVKPAENQKPAGDSTAKPSRVDAEKELGAGEAEEDEEDGDRTEGMIPRPLHSNRGHSSDSAGVHDSSPRFESQRSVYNLSSSTPTPPLSSPNSSNEDGSRAVKMKDLADSLTSPAAQIQSKDQKSLQSHHRMDEPPDLSIHHRSISLSSSISTSSASSAISKRPPPLVDPDGMDGIEHIPPVSEDTSGEGDAGDSTVVFHSHNYNLSGHSNPSPHQINGSTFPFPTSSTPASTPPVHQYSHHNAPNEGRTSHQSPYHDYRNSRPDRYRQTSSSHSRSSSLSISSLSQQSSIYGGEEQQMLSPSRLAGLKVHPGHQLSSHASQPNFRPPPLRSTPVRRAFPSLRHAASQPAFHSPTGGNASSQPSSCSSQPPSLPPMSASSASSQSHQYASFPPQSYSASPISAPPNHHLNQHSHHRSFSGRSRIELPPLCTSRLAGHSSRFSREEEPSECNNASGEENDSGFNEALGALETVMRFLQEQPTSFATPRDYMVVGELFGRMKEKKQEMLNLGFGKQTSSSTSGSRIVSQNCKSHFSAMGGNTNSSAANMNGGGGGGNGLSLVLEDNGHHSMHSAHSQQEPEIHDDDRMEY